MITPVRQVVSGLLLHEHLPGEPRMLLQQRSLKSDFPLHWESPGGKVEPGETFEQALVREWREELGVLVQTKGPVVCSVRFPPEVCGTWTDIHFLRVYLPLEFHRFVVSESALGFGWFAPPFEGILLVPSITACLAKISEVFHR